VCAATSFPGLSCDGTPPSIHSSLFNEEEHIQVTTTTTTPRNGGQRDADTRLDALIEQIQQPENQGEPLLARDYAVLLVVTVLVPILLTVWGLLSI